MSRTVFFGLLTGAGMPFGVPVIYFVVPQVVTLALTGLFWSLDPE